MEQVANIPNHHSRFKDLPWYKLASTTYVLIGGAGGIGSWTALLAARAGFKLMVYDADEIEEHNLGGQLYKRRQVKKHKTDALYEVVEEFASITLMNYCEMMDEDSPTNAICISAFDNMKARKAMFENWEKIYSGDHRAIFIDGRLNAEQMWIYCVPGGRKSKGKQDAYKGLLFDDSELIDEPCTAKQTSHSAAMIASHIIGFLTNHMTNVANNTSERTVPFEWTYFTPMDLLIVS